MMPRALDLRLELRDVTPTVWRVLRVPADLRLDDLHHAIQAAFGWNDFHPHVFEVGEQEYGPRFETDEDDNELDDDDSAWAGEGNELSVAKALAASPEGMTYIYNFVEDWRVRIVLEGEGSLSSDVSAVAVSDASARRTSAARPVGHDTTAASIDGVTCIAGENAGPQQESSVEEPFSIERVNRRLARKTRPRATAEFPAGPRATSDQQLLANLTLAVLMLGSRPTRHGTREAWKNVRSEVLDSLQEAGLIDTAPQRKSVTLTDAGVSHAQRLISRLKSR